MTEYTEIDFQVGVPFFVVDRKPDINWNYASPNTRDWYVLGYARSGSAYYNFSGNTQTAAKGNVIFTRSNESYSAYSKPDDPWSFISAAFTIEFGDPESEQVVTSLPNIFKCSDSVPMADNFGELVRVWSAKPCGYKLKCRSILLDIMYTLLADEDRRRNHSAHFSKINEIVEFLRQNYTGSYSVDELSELSGLSPSYFRSLFKQLTGLTTVQFQNKLKIDKAKDLIISHSCNITEAAEAVGFSDVYYFSRMFRKITGKNPSEFL